MSRGGIVLVGVAQGDEINLGKETGPVTCMARWPGLLYLNQKRVFITVIEHVADLLKISRGFSLLPQAVPRTAPEMRISCLKGLVERVRVHVGQHQYLS